MANAAGKTKAKRVRPRRDFQALEQRRREAARLFGEGMGQAEVARRLRVSRQSVSRWFVVWSEHGAAGLAGAGRAGRLPRLTAEQRTRVDAELRRGPAEHGYSTELWTLARVAEVIEKTTGVRYHPGHVWRLLTDLGWTRQRPARRAAERDEAEIARWVRQEWPRIKKAPSGAARGSSSKTNPASR